MVVTLFSFGFKHAPPEADTVFDVRFLPNPYYVPELSPETGLDRDVASYVLDNKAADVFFRSFEPFIIAFLQCHADTNRESFHMGIGCTGGRHRSVAVAEKIGKVLGNHGVVVKLFHRDIDKV
jgi:UPF0042 nucleotide-binding protein